MMLMLAPPRLWIQLTGFTFLMAGSVGLLSIAINWVRPESTSAAQSGTATEYLIRGLVYTIFLALGLAERRYRARVEID